MRKAPTAASKRRRMLVTASAIVVGVAAAAAAAVVLVRDTPAKTVERYLTALLERDVEAALAEASPEALPEPDQEVFLVEEAMRTDWSFDSVQTGEETELHDRAVTVELSGFDRTATATFELDETDDGWKIANPFAWVAFERSSLTYLDVDGIRLAANEPGVIDPDLAVPLFPGAHRFFESLPEDLEPSSPEDLERLLPPGFEDSDELPKSPVPELAVRGELLEDARAQITAIIDYCADPVGDFPDADLRRQDMAFCPFDMQRSQEYEDGSSFYVDDSSIEWTVEEYPEFSLADPPGLSDVHEEGFAGVEAVVDRAGAISVSAEVTRYETVEARGTDQRLTFECVFAPAGFRGMVDENDEILMYFLEPASATVGGTFAGLENEDCTHAFEEL